MRSATIVMSSILLLAACAGSQSEYRRCRFADLLLYSCAGFEESYPRTPSLCDEKLPAGRTNIALFASPESESYLVIPESGAGIPYRLIERDGPWTEVELWSGESGFLRDGQSAGMQISHLDGPGPIPTSFAACAGHLFESG